MFIICKIKLPYNRRREHAVAGDGGSGGRQHRCGGLWCALAFFALGLSGFATLLAPRHHQLVAFPLPSLTHPDSDWVLLLLPCSFFCFLR
jgi:hypothetical protein